MYYGAFELALGPASFIGVGVASKMRLFLEL